MDYKLTEEQKALKKEYNDFFKAEMSNAPEVYQTESSLEAAYGTDEGWEFNKYMKEEAG